MRQAIATQNEALKAEGKPEVPSKSLIGLAEQMLPQVRLAEWRDQAEAALTDVDEIDLRDLRSVVGADDAARDEESRAIAAQLREALTTRVEKEHSAWLDEIGTALDESRIVRALRLSTRPPKAGARFPAPLASRLTDAAGAALNATATTDRWVAVLEAIAFSPVRSSVVAVSVPDPVPDDLKAVVAKSASALPQIAAQFGIEPPAVTGPPKPRRPMPPRRPREAGGGATGGCAHAAGRRGSRAHANASVEEPTPVAEEAAPAVEEPRRQSRKRHRSPRKRHRSSQPSRRRRRRTGNAGAQATPVVDAPPPDAGFRSYRSAWLACAAMAKVEYETRGRVGIFTLNRPEARNAVNGEVAADFEAALDRFEEDPEVWVGVITATLTGDRPVFSAGADLKAVNTAAGAGISTQEGRIRWLRLSRAGEASDRSGRRTRDCGRMRDRPGV